VCDSSYMGYLSALTRSHIPFDVVLDDAVSPEGLAPYKVLILPNSACLSDAQVEAIKQFVKGGGSVIAEFETGAFDELGRPRETNPLLETFGVAELGRMMRPVSNEEYVRVCESHPALGEFACGRLIARPGYSLACTTAGRVITPSFFMEEVGGSYKTLRGESTNPALVLSEPGGRVAYVPSMIGDFYNRFKMADYRMLIDSIVRWAHGEPLAISVDCPQTVEVELRRSVGAGGATDPAASGRILIHFVNATGDMQRPIAEIIPIRNVRVRLRCGSAARIRALRCGLDLPFAYADGQVDFTLPELEMYELVVVEVGDGSRTP